MKSKYFKFVALVLLAVIVLSTVNLKDTLALDNKANSSTTCFHKWKNIETTIWHNVIYYLDSNYHCDEWYTKMTCELCGDPGGVWDWTNINPHAMHRANDSHAGKMHFVDYECYICPYYITSSWPCPGNPCINFPERVIITE